MPLNLGRKDATKKGFKQKNYFREYLRAAPFWVSRKTEHCDRNEQSGKIEEEKVKIVDPSGPLPGALRSTLQKKKKSVKKKDMINPHG